MRTLLLSALLAAGVAAGGLWSLSAPCGPIGNGGCQAAYALRDIAVTGDTMVSDADGHLRIAGIHYRDGRRNRLDAQMVLVTVDPDTGEELGRLDLRMDGKPDQLRLSPLGEGFAISCNALYVCDLPGGNRPQQSRAMRFDSAGQRLWFTGIEHDVAPPDSDGRAFELGFSASGAVLFAHVAHAARTGEVILTRQTMLDGPGGCLAASDTEAHRGLVGKLDLPQDFVPFLRHVTALSPDGRRIAVLARHFSGAGAVRAALRIFDIDSGTLLARHDIGADLAPALLWHPSRDAVIVAEAETVAADAGTRLRLYGAGEQP